MGEAASELLGAVGPAGCSAFAAESATCGLPSWGGAPCDCAWVTDAAAAAAAEMTGGSEGGSVRWLPAPPARRAQLLRFLCAEAVRRGAMTLGRVGVDSAGRAVIFPPPTLPAVRPAAAASDGAAEVDAPTAQQPPSDRRSAGAYKDVRWRAWTCAKGRARARCGTARSGAPAGKAGRAGSALRAGGSPQDGTAECHGSREAGRANIGKRDESAPTALSGRGSALL